MHKWVSAFRGRKFIVTCENSSTLSSIVVLHKFIFPDFVVRGDLRRIPFYRSPLFILIYSNSFIMWRRKGK